MNIFKILANGHGTVSETNVSAFLGYLLDPNANHSLGYEFLKLFLEQLHFEENESDGDNFEPEKYDFQIFYEQEFEDTKTNIKQTVDICVLCYKTNSSGKSKALMLDFIKNTKKLEKVFLIENKIKKTSITTNQLIKQFTSFKNQLEKELEEPINDIYTIYVTPNEKGFIDEFNSIENSSIDKKMHLFWNDNKDNISIKKLLEDLIIKEENFEIDPFNFYVKNTLKAFIQFIDTDFQSERQVKKTGQRDLHDNVNSLLTKNENLLDDISIKNLKLFEKYLEQVSNKEITFRSSQTHPISIFYQKKKIFGFNRRGKKIAYDIVFKGFPKLKKVDYSDFEIILHYDNNPDKGVRLKPKNNTIEEIISLFEKVTQKLN